MNATGLDVLGVGGGAHLDSATTSRVVSASSPGLLPPHEVAAPRVASSQIRYARVARNSEVTFVYDAKGSYPSMRLFQIARPVPPNRAYGSLPISIDTPGFKQFAAAAYRRAEMNAPRMLDQRL